MKNSAMILITIVNLLSCAFAGNNFESDTIATSSGKLILTCIGHGTLMFEFNKTIMHIDPVSQYADYSKMPKADIILITHHHADHLDSGAVNQIAKEQTRLIYSQTCVGKVRSGTVMKNGDSLEINGITINAVPAYNIIHKRDNGEPFHPKGAGNGYVIRFGNKKVYIAGDTENIPEMKLLTGIDLAFLPMNLPYTMTPKMVSDAVGMFHPKVLYPYHYGDTDVQVLLELMKDKKECEVRIRKLQ